MKLKISRHIFEKYSNIKFHVKPFIGFQVVPSGRADTRTDGQTDMTKLIVVFRDCANAPKNWL